MPTSGLILCEKQSSSMNSLHANEATTPSLTASSGWLCMVFHINERFAYVNRGGSHKRGSTVLTICMYM